MKCRKNDYVTLTNGKTCRVVKGTNLEKGWVRVHERFDYGWAQTTSHRASEIVAVRKWRAK